MKKTLLVLMTCLIAVVFVAATFSFATAADRKMAPASQMHQMSPAQMPTMVMCPPGWHQTKKNTEEIKCSPNKPAPMKCPEGWQYVEALDCKNYAGYGTQTTCSGCEVGCNKIPVVK